ncbi:hypothetical protein [Conexibacter arvalis]|uniref:Uncharacterized protein n=1 Tax=Conexibacter arvalis TaxID=912552 RepID=A0A840I7H6_9ACTN|nr:hypothetical protein [Conexibacter arvalis]MBB4660839.1 hypothetical protein [Conexibacter arvalis]
MRKRSARARSGLAAAAAALLVALGAAGCGSDGDERADLTLPRDAPPPALTQPPGGTTPVPPGGTTPTPPGGSGRTYEPPAPRPNFGRGPTIGALVRERHAEASYGALLPGFVPGGIPVGTRAAICVVPPIIDAVRRQIEEAARRQSPGGEVLTLHSDAILLADCGSSGRWALVTWTQIEGGDATNWIDELRYDGDGRWTGTPPRAYPGCRMPLAAAAAWQVDVRRCGSAARRAPSTPRRPPRAAPSPRPPRPSQPQPQPGPRPMRPAPLDSVTI